VDEHAPYPSRFTHVMYKGFGLGLSYFKCISLKVFEAFEILVSNKIKETIVHTTYYNEMKVTLASKVNMP
jgi:hypothetical protein